MSEPGETPAGRTSGDLADDIVTEVLARLERGENVDYGRILEDHSTLAAQLAPRLAVIRMLRELGAESRRPREVAKVGPEIRFDPGSRIGPYCIKETLGSGGMGTVYLVVVVEATARLPAGREVALKLIHPHLLTRPELTTRFLREADIGLRLRHENVVATLDAGDVEVPGGTLHYVVTERVQGRTLREVIDELGRAPEAYAREIAVQVTDALCAIHAARLVHRDLKPSNVMVTADDRVRVMDLGMARLVDASVSLTQDGQFAGTILYAAPEQLRGERATPAVDLYALGMLLFELLTGKRPFGPGEVAAAARNQTHIAPPYVTDHGVQATPFFTEVVRTLLAGKPEARFTSAPALKEVLQQGDASAWWSQRADREGAAPRRPQTHVERRTPFVGRDAELDQLRTFWQDAREGEGRAVLLSGSTGTGKTRLVGELLRAPASGHYLYTSFANTPTPVSLAHTLTEHFGLAELEENVRRYLRPSPPLAARISRFARGESVRDEDLHLEREGLHAALAGLLRGMAREHPVLWVVEDVHLASPEAQGLVLTLARAVENERALLLLTSILDTPECDIGVFRELHGLERISLERMPTEEIAQLLDASFASDIVGTPSHRQLLRKADGIPGFLFSLLQELEQNGAIKTQDDGRYEMRTPAAPLRLPETLHLTVQATLSRLSDPAGSGAGQRGVDPRSLLDLASVHGLDFDAYLLADALGESPIAILRKLASIERHTGLVRANGRLHRFDQVLVHDFIYEEVAPDLRRHYHSILAFARATRDGGKHETLVFLAQHHVLGDHPEASLPYLLPALESLAREGRDDESLALALSALERTEIFESDEGVDVALHAAPLLIADGRPDEARALAHRIQPQTQHAVRLGDVLRGLDELEEAEEMLERALRDAEGAADTALQIDLLSALGRVAASAGEHTGAVTHLERCVEVAEGTSDQERQLAARRSLGDQLAHAGRHDEARSQHERCVTLAREIPSPLDEIQATRAVGEDCIQMGRLEDAMACFERASQIAHEHGERREEATALGRIALVLQFQEKPEPALDYSRRSFELHHEMGDTQGEIDAGAVIARVEMMLGRRAEAIERYEGLFKTARKWLSKSAFVSLHLSLNQALMWDGRFGPGEACLLRTQEIIGPDTDPSLVAHLHFLLARLYEIVGRLSSSREQVDAGFGFLSNLPPTRLHGIGLFGRGLLEHANGRLPEARAALLEALDLLRSLEDANGISATCIALADLDLLESDPESAMRYAKTALERAKSTQSPHQCIAASALLAQLDPTHVADAEAFLRQGEPLARVEVLVKAHARLGKLTDETRHAERTRALLAHIGRYWPESERAGFPAASPALGPIAAWAGYEATTRRG